MTKLPYSRVIWLSCFMLFGCAHIPGNKTVSKPVSSVKLEKTSVAYRRLEGRTSWPITDWWKAFGDRRLNQVEAKALSTNPTLAETAARIRLADARVREISASVEPNISLDGTVNRQHLSQNGLVPPPFSGSTVNFGDLAANYKQDFDFWGLNKARIAVARSNLNAAYANEAEARILIAISVANTWFKLGEVGQDLRLQRDLLQVNQSQLQIDKDLEKAGLESNLPVLSDNAEREQLINELRHLQALNEAGHYQLAALAGESPDAANRYTSIKLPQYAAFLGVPPRLPIDLLSRRADIVTLRNRIEASNFEIKSARAEFYPDINLSAMIGFQSINLGSLIEAPNLAASIGPAFHLPIFEGGALRANLSARRAQYDENVAQYNQAVLNAAKQVAQALSSIHSQSSRLKHAKFRLMDMDRVLNLVKQRYQSGIVAFTTELQAKENQILARRVVNSLYMKNLMAQLDLIKALGGGYKMPTENSVGAE
ncbi:MAG: efflux transporter outer membrane subunit [Pseudomonadota bacterium]|nr:efflux transporter outer membrane subunit [Pseudomonadota bacterium]